MEINGGGGPPKSVPGFKATERGGAIHRAGLYAQVFKPALDRIVGALLLLVALPIILVAAWFILFSIGRPIFYAQERIGLGGRPFKLYKLRTMIPDRRVSQNGYNADERRLTHKSKGDPRVTNVGRILRSARLDELPQFWNVVKGDMSLVGPRPEMPAIVVSYQPWQHDRHIVKPGITGPWQISVRNGKPMHECTELDIEYIEQMGLWRDLTILAKTPLSMLGGRKGY